VALVAVLVLRFGRIARGKQISTSPKFLRVVRRSEVFAPGTDRSQFFTREGSVHQMGRGRAPRGSLHRHMQVGLRTRQIELDALA
jgi:hypothetical protein